MSDVLLAEMCYRRTKDCARNHVQDTFRIQLPETEIHLLSEKDPVSVGSTV